MIVVAYFLPPLLLSPSGWVRSHARGGRGVFICHKCMLLHVESHRTRKLAPFGLANTSVHSIQLAAGISCLLFLLWPRAELPRPGCTLNHIAIDLG